MSPDIAALQQEVAELRLRLLAKEVVHANVLAVLCRRPEKTSTEALSAQLSVD